MIEKVLVVNSDVIRNSIPESSSIIQIEKSDFYRILSNHFDYISRDKVERDFSYKQIIAYCIIQYKDEIFITQRNSSQLENRLHNCYSIGIGGHINSTDINNDIIVEGMKREFFEEVDIQCSYTYKFIGLINNNQTEVSSVHMGVCFVVSLTEKKCCVKEVKKMTGYWIKTSDISQYFNKLEDWSKILVNDYISCLNLNVKGLNNILYTNTVAENFLCLPAALNSILNSEGYVGLDLYKIANYFGVTFPKSVSYHKIHNYKYSDNCKEFGVTIKDNEINRFFYEYSLPFSENYINILKIDKEFLVDYLHDVLITGSHVICGFDYNALYNRNIEYIGHISIVLNIDIQSDTVLLLDPGPNLPGLKSVNAYDLYIAIAKAQNGLWIIKKR